MTQGTLSSTPSASEPGLSPLKRAFIALDSAQQRIAALENAAREPIAVIGMSCRVPGADNPDEFWRLMRDGVDAIGTVPPDRFDIDALFDPDPEAPGRIMTRCGGFIRDVDQFDCGFFSIAPREAQGMDPQQRLLLEVSWEALENAGQAPMRLETSKTGVYFGLCTSDYSYLQVRSGDPALLNAHYGSGIAHSVASGRLSYLLGLQGPSLTIDTACSSSLVTIHLACQALRSGDCRLALAGGANLILAPELFVALSHSRMLAPDGRCKTFSAAADGFSRGEGCGVVVLKRLADAKQDGDRILAVIRGTGVNQDGPSSALTAPNGPAQEDVIRTALARAGLKPSNVGYIEAHGTGTQLGDPLEVQALSGVFGADRDPATPLVIGSVKTNVGHLEAAAGVTGLIKLVLALRHKEIPPHLHMTAPSPHIDWTAMPLKVTDTRIPWDPIEGRRIGGVSSFGFSGTNAHVVVEEAPADTPVPVADEPKAHLFVLSARSSAALAAHAGRLAAAVAGYEDRDLAHISHTANFGRSHFSERATVIARTITELSEKLSSLARGDDVPGVKRANLTRRDPPRVAFIFSGQGSQYSGMARRLHEIYPAFRDAFDRCAALLAPYLSRPLQDVVFGDGATPDLDNTGFTQPALFAVEYALAETWRSLGVTPDIVAGHSVGEIVAATVAGVFSLEDGIRLIARRGALMAALPAGGAMAAIAASEQDVDAAIARHANVLAKAAVNGPMQTVISGAASAVDEVCASFASKGVRCQKLVVSHAFHSPLMDPVLDPFEREMMAMTLSAPRLRLVSNLTGRAVEPTEIMQPRYWRRHLREAVRFGDGVGTIAAQKPDCVVEIGPHPALLSLFKNGQSAGPALIASLRKGRDDWEQMLEAVSALFLAGAEIDWRGIARGERREIVDLPTYPFQRQRHWFEAKPQPATIPVANARHEGVDDWFYERVWKATELSSPSPRAASSWVVLGDRGGIAAALIDALKARGDKCILVSTAERGANMDAAAVRALWRKWRDECGEISGVIDLHWLDCAPGASGALSLQALVSGSLSLTNAMISEIDGRRARLWVVTRGAQPAGEVRSRLSPLASAVWGLTWSAALEHPELRAVCVDLDPASGTDEIAMLVCELGRDDSDDKIALRSGQRLVARLQKRERGSIVASEQIASAPLVRPDGQYLVTGGLSGLGLEIARWLVARGAKHISLIGRRGADTPNVSGALQGLAAAGAEVSVASIDVGDLDALGAFLDERRLAGLPLRGVIHAAGVIDDAAIASQDWSRFERVLRPKVVGAQNLDQLTRADPLDWFVIFSSAAALLGSPGQANYTAANTILDVMAHERRRLGLPALSINWGPWGQVGMAASASMKERLAATGLTPFMPEEALHAMETVMRTDVAQAGVVAADWTQLLKRRGQTAAPPAYFDKVVPSGEATQTASEQAKPTLSLRDILKAAAPSRRPVLLRNFVRETACKVLGLTEVDCPADGAPLSEVGLDSLLAVELRDVLQKSVGMNLSATLVFDHPSIEALSEFLSKEMRDAEMPTKKQDVADKPARTEGAAMLAEIAELSDTEVELLLASGRR
jgi:acyl transferase domain-containing protein